MSEQREFDFPRAAKLNALERIVCSARGVKQVLQALDGVARDERTCTVTMRRLGVSMGVSAKTAQRAVKAAEAAGLLFVYGDESDGCANTYRINWQAVFALPDGVSGKPATGPRPTPVKRGANPGQIERQPRSICHGTPDKLSRYPGQSVTVPRTTVSGVCPTDSSDQIHDTVRRGRGTDGGGEFVEDLSGKAVAAVMTALALPGDVSEVAVMGRGGMPRRPGWWAWKVKRSELLNKAAMVPFFEAAVTAGFLKNNTLCQIRFLALTRTTDKDESIQNVTGYLVSMIETGSWNYLDPDAIDTAYRILCPKAGPLTADQKARIKSAGRIRSDNHAT